MGTKNQYLVFACLAFFLACSHNALTGKNEISLYSESEMQAMAAEQYTTFLKANKIVPPSASADAGSLKNVVDRVVNAITIYYSNEGLSRELAGYKWESNLIDSKQVNAWCMPGGKMVVYTGLMPCIRNESALAVAICHQIAHALVKHGNERMNQAMVQQLGSVALSVAEMSQPKETQGLFMNAYGIESDAGSQLPFSRKQELEADRLGLRFTAMAGYDPKEAIPFWEGVKKTRNKKRIAEIVAIHPVDDKRIEGLKQEIPVALTYLKPQKAE